MLNATGAALDQLGVRPQWVRGLGDLLQPVRGEQNRANRIADVLADNRENPAFEVAGKSQLLLVVLLLRHLGLAAVVDVDAAADESRERPTVVRNRNPAVENPAVLAVVAAKAVFHLERFTAVEMSQVLRNAALEIVSMDARSPPVPHLLFE